MLPYTAAPMMTVTVRTVLPDTSHSQPLLSAVAGGPCSYDNVTLNLSLLAYVPDATPVSDVQVSFVQPAIKRQLRALKQRLTQQGTLRPWTAFQVRL